MVDWCGHWTWAKPVFADIFLEDDGKSLHVPSESCHGGYTCSSEFEMSEPGTYTFFLQAKGQSSTIGVGHHPDSSASWGKSELYLSGWRKEDQLYCLEFHLSDTKAHMIVKQATKENGFFVPVHDNVLQDESLVLEKPTYPWVVVCGIMHRSWLRARCNIGATTWSPSAHSIITSKGFRTVVLMMFLLRQDDTTTMSALPRELMFLIIEQLWATWRPNEESRALLKVAGAIPTTHSERASTSPRKPTKTPDRKELAHSSSTKRCLLQ